MLLLLLLLPLLLLLLLKAVQAAPPLLMLLLLLPPQCCCCSSSMLLRMLLLLLLLLSCSSRSSPPRPFSCCRPLLLSLRRPRSVGRSVSRLEPHRTCSCGRAWPLAAALARVARVTMGKRGNRSAASGAGDGDLAASGAEHDGLKKRNMPLGKLNVPLGKN